MILSIETATSNCAVALHPTTGEMIALKELNEANIHASKLFVFIEQILKDNGVSMKDIQAIAVSKGPGSYTGLRIGVSAAKGLCYSLDLPLISVNTLHGMALTVKNKFENENAIYIPMIDARRMEVYNAIYNSELKEIEGTQATIIDENSFKEYEDKESYFFGDGMLKCKSVLQHLKKAKFIDGINASAKEMSTLSYEKFKRNDTVDVAYFEPYYLKEFVTQSVFHKK